MVLLAAAFILLRPAPDPTLGQWVAARLSLARGVALAKLASRGRIEDKVREGQVLDRLRGSLQHRDLSPRQVSASVEFFRGQIEASKQAQRAWQTEWRRTGAPLVPIPTLAHLRVQIDALEASFVAGKYRPTMVGAAPKEPFLRPAWITARNAGVRFLRP